MQKSILIFSLCFATSSPASVLVITPRVPLQVKTEFLSDLNHLRKVSGSQASGLHGFVFGPSANKVSGEAYYNFFMSRVSIVDSEPSKKDFFVNAGGKDDPGKLYVTSEYTKYLKTMPEIERWAVLIHEARHNEIENTWPHTICPDPFIDAKGNAIIAPWGQSLSGKYACDTEALGSYGVTIILARNIELHCDTCSKDLRTQAGTYARQILLRITDFKSRNTLLKDLYPDEI
jgi:hypothetical protein